MLSTREIVERLGDHPASLLGLDLAEDTDRFRWLVAACLLSGRPSEERALDAFHALEVEDLTRHENLARAEPGQLAEPLAKARYPRPERPALLLTRLARALGEGSLSALGSGADDLEGLGASLVALAPGLGRATVLRFLRPLREHWSAARDIPLAGPACAAARHLGWIGEGHGDEVAPEALEAVRRADDDAPALSDLEAALERLGRVACAPDRPDRCPLAELCPLR